MIILKAEVNTEGPVLTSTVIGVVKILGKYLYMLKVLQPIALEVFVGITQVFQYFVSKITTIIIVIIILLEK